MSRREPVGADHERARIMARRRIRRRDLLAQRMGLSQEEHRRLSTKVLSGLMEVFPALRASRVGIYWPSRRQINVFPLAKRILADGGEISLPVMLDRRRPLQFRAWKPGDPLAAGPRDTLIPRDGAAVRPEALIVPLVGFDTACHRLGDGDGCYDRTLAASDPRPLTIGIGFEFMRLATIDPLPHDISMDFIVTEAVILSQAGDRRSS